MSRSTLFSAKNLSTKKGRFAALYYREYGFINRLAVAYQMKAKTATDIESQLTSEFLAAYARYKATIAALRLANNRCDSRHALFAAMNRARADMQRRKGSLDLFREYRGSVFAG